MLEGKDLPLNGDRGGPGFGGRRGLEMSWECVCRFSFQLTLSLSSLALKLLTPFPFKDPFYRYNRYTL